MNKSKIDKLIPTAVSVIDEVNIAEDNKVLKTYRSQISTFGAAISGGSLLAAVAFFSENGSSSVERNKLMKAIYKLVTNNKGSEDNCLYKYVEQEVKKGNENKCKEDILNAAIAIKLAMNVYKLV